VDNLAPKLSTALFDKSRLTLISVSRKGYVANGSGYSLITRMVETGPVAAIEPPTLWESRQRRLDWL
jgi:hypothetical protein